MSGKVVVFDTVTNNIVAQRKDHSKYVVQVTSLELDEGRIWIATAGWDGKVLVYLARVLPDETFEFNEPVASILQPTNPEALLFVRHPQDGQLNLIVSRRDSSFLYYYQVSEATSAGPSTATTLPLSGRQNLAPHSNAWVAFTPAAISPCPTDPTLLSVATSAVPHMKLLVVRLLFPSDPEPTRQGAADTVLSAGGLLNDASSTNTTAAQQARAALVLQDREAAAIAIHCTTMSPQTQYSTPALAWRPEGSGIWVNSDDGVVRGVEASTGKVIANLEGHEAGSKIRCLWAGYVDIQEGERKECMISGGFDQRLIVWW
jgi:WD40 repeat protein